MKESKTERLQREYRDIEIELDENDNTYKKRVLFYQHQHRILTQKRRAKYNELIDDRTKSK